MICVLESAIYIVVDDLIVVLYLSYAYNVYALALLTVMSNVTIKFVVLFQW